VTEVDNSQRAGGIAALVGALTVVIGLAMFAFVLSDYAIGDPEPAESVAFLAENQASIFIWNLITLIVFSVSLVVVALALNTRLKDSASLLTQTATAFGIIWAGLLIAAGMILNIGFGTVVDLYATDVSQAETVWLAIDSVSNGLSGGMEIVGPVWVLLVSLAALKAGALSKALNYLGILIAAAGFVTIIPALEAVGAIFGLGLIVWLTWLGIAMLQDAKHEPA
jgi:hypothetical protein